MSTGFLMRCVFLSMSILAVAVNGSLVAQDVSSDIREYYELRIYQIYDYEKQEALEAHLRDAYLPALARLGIDRVGVFTDSKNQNDHSVFMLIPFQSVEQFSGLRDALQADDEYQKAEAAFSDVPLKEPMYSRIESRFLKSFAGMPQLELSEYSKDKTERMFELRLYESHSDDHARRKVKMFNDGEIQVMRDVKMGPVFFGETLIGPDVPNLVYMLSAENEGAHKQHWNAFLADPRWDEMKVKPEFADTVSKIRSWFLTPTDYSGF